MSGFDFRLTREQHAFTFLDCKYPAFVGGFGSGKTEALAVNAILDAQKGGSSSLIALYEPTYDLVRLILAPRIEAKLLEGGCRYQYNKSEQVIYTSNSGFGDFILRTMDNPARIIGYEAFRSHADEIDTLPMEKARDVWQKIIARNRQQPKTAKSKFNRVSVYTTPEGFNFVYEFWVRNKRDGYEMVQAKTLSNPFLPDDYVDSLRATYPENLIEAYLNGEFVNLSSGTVYACFDRRTCATDIEHDGIEPLHIGMDFNVCNMSAAIGVMRNGVLHIVDEITGGADTPSIIETIKTRWPGVQYQVYPDATGKNRNPVGASESSIKLLRAEGFRVFAKSKNPFVKDRVVAVNKAFEDGRVKVNLKRCPRITENLEQQIYNTAGEPDKTANQDHTNDATGYMIHWMMPVVSRRAFAY